MKMKKQDEKIIVGILELAKMGFYVELKEEFREFIRKRIKNKFGSLKQFSLQTKIVPSSYLSSILTEGRYTKLSLWLKICNALDIEVKKFKENILKIRARHAKFFLKPEQLPILSSPGLASLVGHGLGDGHISEEGCFEYTNGDLNLHEKILIIISKLFGPCKYSEYKWKVERRRFNTIVGKILHLAGVPKGNKILQSFSIPQWILDGSEEIKKSFIRALFDDEGTVKTFGYEILIKFSKNEKYIDSLQKFIEQIKQLLEDLGIEVTSIRRENIIIGKNGRTIQLVLGIHGYKNFLKFSKEIKFNHRQKQKKLEKMVNNYRSLHNKKRETQRILYENLSEPLTIFDLTNNLNMTYITVYKGMRKLEREGLIKRIGHNKNQFIVWRKIK